MVKLENYQTTDGILMTWHEAFKAASKGLKHLRREGRDDVYEVRRVDLANGSFVTERKVTLEGYYERVVWESKWQEKERYECFCCTCPDYGGVDAACRNHGYDGKRPCDIHNLPGYSWDDSDQMPESVLTVRAKQKDQQ